MLLRIGVLFFTVLHVSSIVVIKSDNIEENSSLNGYISVISGHEEIRLVKLLRGWVKKIL